MSEWGTPQPPVTPSGGSGVVVQRTRRAPIIPPTPTDAPPPGVVISRNWAASRTGRRDTGLTRNRVVAGDLPDWAPLPPGELLVDRNAGKPS